MTGVSPTGPGHSAKPKPYGLGDTASVPNASRNRPGWFKCAKTAKGAPFTVGTAYEVYRYDGATPIVITDRGGSARLPYKGCEFAGWGQ